MLHMERPEKNKLDALQQEAVSGVYTINKPKGITSHDVVDYMRRITSIRRIGHAGTLDPLAHGVLVVLVGRQYTKQQDVYMAGEKEYIAEITFGKTSETYDAEGPFGEEADHTAISAITKEMVEAVLPQFVGTIEQRPPAHSAIKVRGEALYKKARRGDITDDDIPMRTVTIDSIELLDFTPSTETAPLPRARIIVCCQKGVYIRSLSHDIGQLVGTGAYMSDLQRTRVGEATINQSTTLEEANTAIKEYCDDDSTNVLETIRTK